MSDRDRRLARIETATHQLRETREAAARDMDAVTPLHVPNSVEFATSTEYLGQALYPRQALLLKVLTCEYELLTNYDRQVLGQLEAGFSLEAGVDGHRYAGEEGLAPGTEARMRACRDAGRPYFREVVLVVGRRGGKGYLTAILTSLAVWRLLALGNPQRAFGIERRKAIRIMCFAADKPQATANLFTDVAGLIRSSTCFAPFVEYLGPDEVRLHTPAQLERMAAGGRKERGHIVIDARPTTGGAGRGPTAIGLVIDEAAHLPAEGLQRSAGLLYVGATPALAQFGQDSLTVLASSPADQTGAFYAAHLRALKANADGTPVDPTALTVVLASWAPYEDWQLTNPSPSSPATEQLLMWPGGPAFPPIVKPILEYDDTLRALERDDPDNFAVEFRARWRTSPSAYLQPEMVRAIFGSYRAQPLHMQDQRTHDATYAMHADPSKTNANFAIAIGHLDQGPDGFAHVVFDVLEHFDPRDFPDGRIDYVAVRNRLQDLIKRFMPAYVTFDQFESGVLIAELQTWAAREPGLWIRPNIFERTATARSNWGMAELFKMEANFGRVHAPHYALAEQELLHLQERNGRVDHPSVGPVRTSDLADAMSNVVAQLLGIAGTTLERMSMPLHATTLGRPRAYDERTLALHDLMSRGGRSIQDALHSANPARSGVRRSPRW